MNKYSKTLKKIRSKEDKVLNIILGLHFSPKPNKYLWRLYYFFTALSVRIEVYQAIEEYDLFKSTQ
jgi:hypothetical protein